MCLCEYGYEELQDCPECKGKPCTLCEMVKVQGAILSTFDCSLLAPLIEDRLFNLRIEVNVYKRDKFPTTMVERYQRDIDAYQTVLDKLNKVLETKAI